MARKVLLLMACASAAAIVFTTGVFMRPAVADDKSGEAKQAKAAASAPAATAEQPEKRKARKTTVRLPNYYAQVVDDKQREQIAKIQGEYNAKINALKAQLDELTKKRDAAIEGVLTQEQLKKIADLKAAAKVKRASSKQAKSQ